MSNQYGHDVDGIVPDQEIFGPRVGSSFILRSADVNHGNPLLSISQEEAVEYLLTEVDFHCFRNWKYHYGVSRSDPLSCYH